MPVRSGTVLQRVRLLTSGTNIDRTTPQLRERHGTTGRATIEIAVRI